MSLRFLHGLSFLFFLSFSASYSAALSEMESHRQMVGFLENVRSQNIVDNPYQGEGLVRRLKDQWAALTDADPTKKRIDLLYHLGIAELLLGLERQAIERFSQAEKLLATQRDAPSQVINEIKFRLGLAWLRLGETQNCVLDHRATSCILPIRASGVHKLKEGSQQAISHFQSVLDNTSEEAVLHRNARWLLNIAHMTLGQYHTLRPPLRLQAVAD